MYEHQNNIAQLKAEGTVALKLAQDGNRSSEMELRKDKRNLKVELKEMELSHEDMIKTLKKVIKALLFCNSERHHYHSKNCFDYLSHSFCFFYLLP